MVILLLSGTSFTNNIFIDYSSSQEFMITKFTDDNNCFALVQVFGVVLLLM